MTFTPKNQTNAARRKLEVPYFEDTNHEKTPMYRTSRTPIEALKLIEKELSKMDAILRSADEGFFDINEQQRSGYEIRFLLSGHEGKIRVAGLPMRLPSATKENQVRSHALMTVLAMLQSARVSQIFNPDAHPLVPYLLVSEDKTVAQMFEENRLKLLGSGT